MTDRQPFAQWPTSVAWRAGRRLYVVTPYGSQLNEAVRALGGKWDPAARALWVGSGKADALTEVLTAHLGSPDDIAMQAAMKAARREQVAGVVALGHRLELAAYETDAREVVKAAGGVWDPATESWCLPTPEALTVARREVESLRRARITARHQQRRDQAAAAAKQVRADTTRTILEPETKRTLTWHLPPTRRPAAEIAAPKVGTVEIHQDRAWLLLGVELSPQVDYDDTMTGWLVTALTVEVAVGAAEEEIIARRQRARVVQVLAESLDGLSDGMSWLSDDQPPTGDAVLTMTSSMSYLTYCSVRSTPDGGYIATRYWRDPTTDDTVAQWAPLTDEQQHTIAQLAGDGPAQWRVTVARRTAPVDVSVLR